MNAVFTSEQYTINMLPQPHVPPPLPYLCGGWGLVLVIVLVISTYRMSFIITPFRNAASFFGGSLSSQFSHSRMRAYPP